MGTKPDEIDVSQQDPLDFTAQAIAMGKAAEAVKVLSRHQENGGGSIGIMIALAHALLAAGELQQAIVTAREAAHLAPARADAILALAQTLAANSDFTGAIAEYQRAARLSPHDLTIPVAIAGLWAAIGEWDKARIHLQQASALGAEEGALASLHSQIAEQEREPRLPAAFVRHLFDQFSADYDQRMLNRLGYAAPAILRELAALYWGPRPKQMRILDLGCGTGLAGHAFRDVAGELTGLDLSPKMLAMAKATGLYQSLIETDIEVWLESVAPGRFDAVIAADVLVYLGDLSKTFRGVANALAPNGVFLCTVEQGQTIPFSIGERRRYRHSEEYLRDCASRHGLGIASLIAATLRYDGGQPVEGWAMVLTKG